MQITYLGHCCFKLKSKDASLLTDPANPKTVGAAIPKTETDIVTISQHSPGHNDLTRLKNEPFVIDAAGEYEVKGILVSGLPAGQAGLPAGQAGLPVDAESLIFLIVMESVRVSYLNYLKELDEKKLEELDGVDILLVNIGRASGLPAEKIVKLVNQIEPAVVIPMGYDDAGLKEFLQEYGSEGEKMEKLVVSKGGLGEETRVVILTR